jgi:hypothetical protein
VAQARAELEKANARFLLAIRGKLTPEQWKALQEERAARQQMRHGPGAEHQWRRQPGAGDNPPPGGPQGRLDLGPGFGPGPGPDFDEPGIPGLGLSE